MALLRSLGLLLLAGFATACAARPAPRVHFAEATEAQLEPRADGETWFEFRQGDEVPMAMLFTGVVEAGSPVHLRAKKTFWLVIAKNQEPRFSFDGQHVVYQNSGLAAIALGREKATNQVGVMVYLGSPEDAPAELRRP